MPRAGVLGWGGTRESGEDESLASGGPSESPGHGDPEVWGSVGLGKGPTGARGLGEFGGTRGGLGIVLVGSGVRWRSGGAGDPGWGGDICWAERSGDFRGRPTAGAGRPTLRRTLLG
jgi:hypothetical protein